MPCVKITLKQGRVTGSLSAKPLLFYLGWYSMESSDPQPSEYNNLKHIFEIKVGEIFYFEKGTNKPVCASEPHLGVLKFRFIES